MCHSMHAECQVGACTTDCESLQGVKNEMWNVKVECEMECERVRMYCRTDAGGLDMNRLWGCASSALEPALYHVLQLLQR